MKIGYARISTVDQNPQLQLEALEAAGAERIYKDEVSSREARRPKREECFNALRRGDTLIVWKFDRLARNTRELLEFVDELEERNIRFQSLTEQIDTRGAMGRAMLTIMGAFAQLERDVIQERTLAGIASARRRGRRLGRPQSITPQRTALIRRLYSDDQLTQAEIAAQLGISQSSVSRALAALSAQAD